MSNTLQTIFNLFRYIGNLPDEIICKIVYEFHGIQHPIVKLLLDKTNVEDYFKQMPYTQSLIKAYQQNGFTSNTKNLLLNCQKEYANKYNCNAIIYDDIGYFLPRPFGKLYYETKNNHKLVEGGMELKYWRLNGIINNAFIFPFKFSNKIPLLILNPVERWSFVSNIEKNRFFGEPLPSQI